MGIITNHWIKNCKRVVQNNNDGCDESYKYACDYQKEKVLEVVGSAQSNAQCNGHVLSRVNSDVVFPNDR